MVRQYKTLVTWKWIKCEISENYTAPVWKFSMHTRTSFTISIKNMKGRWNITYTVSCYYTMCKGYKNKFEMKWLNICMAPVQNFTMHSHFSHATRPTYFFDTHPNPIKRSGWWAPWDKIFANRLHNTKTRTRAQDVNGTDEINIIMNMISWICKFYLQQFMWWR